MINVLIIMFKLILYVLIQKLERILSKGHFFVCDEIHIRLRRLDFTQTFLKNIKFCFIILKHKRRKLDG